MRNSGGKDAKVTLGEGVVTIKRYGSSTPAVANILGMDVGEDGRPVKIWLDRLIHAPTEDCLGEWQVSGAISSILSAG